MKLLDPRDYGITNQTIFQWRAYLKEKLLAQRHFRSDWSGEKLFAVEVHEGILTRANVPKGVWWHFMIFCEINSFLLLPEEHRPSPPSRAWCIQKAYQRYGQEAVKEWYESLPFKVRPFQLGD
jgi:hypothetical protein